MRSCIRVVVLLSLILTVTLPANAQFGNMLKGQVDKQLKRMIARAVGADAPLQLDQNTAFPQVAPPDHFNPQKLTALADLNRPLPPGDYAVDAQFYCTEYSIHRPCEGLPYKFGPVQGRLAKPLCALLNRGTLKGISPVVLEADAWRIQAGLALNEWPPADQALVRKLMPDYENTLQGDYVQQLQHDYDTTLKHVTGKSFDEELGRLGDVGKQMLDLEQERQVLTDQSISDDQLPNLLYQQADPGGNPVLASDSNHPSPWIQVRPGVIARYTIVGGYLQKNLFEFRIMPSATASRAGNSGLSTAQFTLADNTQQYTDTDLTVCQIMSMDESDWSDSAPDFIGYPIDDPAQCPIIVPIPDSSSPPDDTNPTNTPDTPDNPDVPGGPTAPVIPPRGNSPHKQTVKLVKSIVINLAQQKLYAYSGSTIDYAFDCATAAGTGEPAAGSYKILEKGETYQGAPYQTIPLQYALVFSSDGEAVMGLGDSSLETYPHSTDAEHGCVALSMEDAKSLFAWVLVGASIRVVQK